MARIPVTNCGDARPGDNSHGCGRPLTANNRSQPSPGLCRDCFNSRRRSNKFRRPAPQPQPAGPEALCKCEAECLLASNLAQADITDIWKCRHAPRRASYVHRLVQAQRLYNQGEQERRVHDETFVSVKEATSAWEILEHNIAFLGRTLETQLPPEWFEVIEPAFLQLVNTVNRHSPVQHTVPVFRDKTDSNAGMGSADSDVPAYLRPD